MDHVVPFSRGGSDHETNLVTACWQCNLTINDTPIESKPKPIQLAKMATSYQWDGLASLYRKLRKENDEWTRHLELYA